MFSSGPSKVILFMLSRIPVTIVTYQYNMCMVPFIYYQGTVTAYCNMFVIYIQYKTFNLWLMVCETTALFTLFVVVSKLVYADYY